MLASGQQERLDKAQIIGEAASQLVALSSEAGELARFCRDNGIAGEFTIDLTITGKGKVLTVFMVSSGTEEVKTQNLLKSKLHEIQFTNITIPKSERIKFRQTLTF